MSAAVHAVKPSIQVVGLGAQGTQIFDMLAMGTTMNGVVYHPYHYTSCIPETVYEWQWLDYGSWIAAIRPTASTCKLTFTVPHPHPNPNVMNAMTGTRVPLSAYKWPQSGTQLTVAGLPISDQPQIIVLQ